MRVAPSIELNSATRLELEKLSRRRTTAVAHGAAEPHRSAGCRRDGGTRRLPNGWAWRRAWRLFGGADSSNWASKSTQGCSPAGTDTGNFCGDGRRSDFPDDAVQAQRSHALVAPQDGA